tara:strand:+ start:891 stop:2249 length:1359 start_codon:yes stop_codon:yes gene_type:complete
MAKDKLTDYDATASNNSDVGGVNTAEGMLPSKVNDAIRELMSHLADFSAGTTGVDVLNLQDDDNSASIKIQAPSELTTTTTFTLPDGDGSNGQALLTDGAGALAWANPASPNLIINGAMQVAQRGTSFTSTGYTLDRMQMLTANTDNVAFTTTQSSTAPDGFASSLKVDITTAESALDSNELFRLLYKAEGQDLQQLNYGSSAATSVTLSFYVRSNVTGVYAVEFRLNAGGTSTITKQYTISSANTWERKTLTLPANTAAAIDNDNSNGLEISFALAAGSNFTTGALGTSWASTATASRYAGQAANVMSSASNEWLITGVSLEAGDVATPFEHESVAETLQKCQRYYYNSYTSAQSSGSAGGGIQAGTFNAGDRYNVDNCFSVEMRAVPTVLYYGGRSGSANTVDRVSLYNSDTLRTFSTEPQITLKGLRGTFDTNNDDKAIRYHFTASAEL